MEPERDRRGYYGIGIEGVKFSDNIGVLMRSAYNLGAGFIFTVGARYHRQGTDTPDSAGQVPLLHWNTAEQARKYTPERAVLIGVEITDTSENLVGFSHPECAIYILGAEDRGLSKETLDVCERVVEIPSNHCMNVAVAGAIVMYDRYYKRASGLGYSNYGLLKEQKKLMEELSQANCALADAEWRLGRLGEVLRESGMYDEVMNIFEGEVGV